MRTLGEVNPDEIRIPGCLGHDSLIDEIETESILDIGAGKSYLLLPENYSYLPTAPLRASLEVQFADETTCRITEQVTVALSLLAQDEETRFERSNITILVIRTPIRAENTKLQLLLGRNLIWLFNIDIFRASRAQIGHTTLFNASAEDEDPVETETRPHSRDRLNWITQIVSPRRLEGMPRCLLEDITDEEYLEDDGNVTAEEAAEISRELANPKESEVTVRIGESDAAAPWGRSVVSIPWRDHRRPGLNLRSVWTRDQITCKRLNPDDKALYEAAVKQLTDGGFATSAEGDHLQKPKHYIAVRPVIRRDRETTKCRVCLDAREINTYTWIGSVLSPPVAHCLIKFRNAPFAATYDLEKAFWQLRYEEHEVGWYSTICAGRALMFARMAFGANYSPSGLEVALRQVIQQARERLKGDSNMDSDEPPRPDPNFENHNYVDDMCNTHQESADKLLQESTWFRWILNKFGFPSSKFTTNAIPMTAEQPYLGYVWSLPLDHIRLQAFEIPDPTTPSTIRGIVSTVAKFYDPLGLCLKTSLHGRMLVREAFRETTATDGLKQWDWAVPYAVTSKVSEWVASANRTHINVPRHTDTTTVNIFCDASATCWCYEVRDANMELVYSRGGLTQAKATIPRNELVALYEATVDVEKLRHLGKSTKIYLFVDSECTVHRINCSSRKLAAFESRRVEKIRSVLEPLDAEVIHLPGAINPADYPTRPLNQEDRPPIDKDTLRAYQTDANATRARRPFGLGKEESEKEQDFLGLMVLRPRRKKNQTTAKPSGAIDQTPVVEDSETSADLETQDIAEATSKRTEKIKRSQDTHGTTDEVTGRDDITIDDQGLLRKRGRIIIPHQDHSLTVEIIRRIHDKIGHAGSGATTRAVAQHYSWRNMGKQIRSFVNECEPCRMIRTGHATRAVAGQALQFLEVDEIPVGSIVGIDIVAIEAANGENYSCAIVATCAVTKWLRAAPLRTQLGSEITAALETMFNSTLFPTVMVMDNAPAFRGKAMKRLSVRSGCRLAYLPPYASAYAGWIERSHGTILSAVRALCSRDPGTPWHEHLTEACFMANCRPYSEDPEEGPLAPINLVYGGSHIVDPEATDATADTLLAKAHMGHLIRPQISDLHRYQTRQTARRRRILKSYLYDFNKRRTEVRNRLLKKHRDTSDSFGVDTWVHVYRPVSSKVKKRWSEARKVVGSPSGATRTVRRADGMETLEWVANLRPASPPECSVNGIEELRGDITDMY